MKYEDMLGISSSGGSVCHVGTRPGDRPVSQLTPARAELLSCIQVVTLDRHLIVELLHLHLVVILQV